MFVPVDTRKASPACEWEGGKDLTGKELQFQRARELAACAALLPAELQQPGLGQAEARSQERLPARSLSRSLSFSLSPAGSGVTHSARVCCCLPLLPGKHARAAQLEAEQPGPELVPTGDAGVPGSERSDQRRRGTGS